MVFCGGEGKESPAVAVRLAGGRSAPGDPWFHDILPALLAHFTLPSLSSSLAQGEKTRAREGEEQHRLLGCESEGGNLKALLSPRF